MKKKSFLAFSAISAVLFSACTSNEVYDPSNAAKQKEAQYAAAFVKRYGQIAADQDWGFGEKVGTRGADPNNNQWKDYVFVPEDITDAELEEAKKWFEEHQNPTSIEVNWTDFFVQQVAVSHGNMDYLVAKKTNGEDDHVNNFNAGQGKFIMLMQESGSSFGYKSTLDSKMHYLYTIQYINGSYYVGLDYEATGQNPNQQEAADGFYNDWILKISPAIYKNTERIIAEDLGVSDDFDFNDVVFDVATNKGATIVTLQAAGGTLPLYIGGKEVHELFGVSTSTMVNTGNTEKAPVIFRLPAGEVDIVVKDQKVGTYTLRADIGKAPQKICVPTTYEWTTERQSIESKYPKFSEWTGNTEIDWLSSAE